MVLNKLLKKDKIYKIFISILTIAFLVILCLKYYNIKSDIKPTIIQQPKEVKDTQEEIQELERSLEDSSKNIEAIKKDIKINNEKRQKLKNKTKNTNVRIDNKNTYQLCVDTCKLKEQAGYPCKENYCDSFK